MNIQDLLIETNLEEGPAWDKTKAGLKGIAQGTKDVATGAAQGVAGGIGGLARGVGNVVGGVQGAYQGAKDAFAQGKQQGQQVAQQAVSGQPAPAAKPNFNNQLAGGQQKISVGGTNNPQTFQNEPGQEVQTGTVPATNTKVPTQVSNVATSAIDAKAGQQAVDNAIQTVKKVPADDQPAVIDYAVDRLADAEQELNALRKNAGIPAKQAQEPDPKVVPISAGKTQATGFTAGPNGEPIQNTN